ncbi:MAG: hypothetical protein ACI9XB_001769 [Gammaproteobacteria bacterium]|jgi:hypothetical protein
MNRNLHLLFLLLCTSFLYGQGNSKTEYFRQLRYNHVSPHIAIVGIHPIDEETAKSTSHYIFKYDSSSRLIEVINNHYHSEKKHALASLGVYRLAVNYKLGNEIRNFYDPNGKRISNDRGVYKEVYSYDKNDFRTQLNFYDLNEAPMESNWKVAAYHWERKGELVIERRFNLEKAPVNVSPYFDFGVTGILLDERGAPKAHYNLNEDLELVDNAIGVASYQDSFDLEGNHIKYTYHNVKNELTLNQWQFAVGQKSYDKMGNNILLERFDTQGELIRSQPIYSNATIELSPSATAQDSTEIRKKSLGYLIALQKMDPVLMNEVMNDSLNKVTIGYDRSIKAEVARPTTRDQMMAFAKDWNKSNSKFPWKPNNQVTILDIYDRIATVRLVSDNWVEYLHLIKLNEEWDIINLVWQHKDVGRYPK